MRLICHLPNWGLGVSDDLASVTRICKGAAYRSSPTAKRRSRTAACPYCTGARHCDLADLQASFYGMTWARLQRLKTTLHGLDGDGGDATSSKAVLSTVTDVLLALYVVSDEPAPPEQLRKLLVDVLDGRLDRLPLPSGGRCFCGSGRRYGKCHRRAAPPSTGGVAGD